MNSIEKGLVSVIMPAYNAEKYIESAIASLQAQDYTHWELLVVNDGSKDNTGAIIDALAAQDVRIKPIHQPNQGVSAARNAALAQMQGEFFLTFDADDILTPQSIAIRVAHFQANPQVYFVDGIIVKKDALMQNTLQYCQGNLKGNPQASLMQLQGHAFIMPSWMVRRVEAKTYQMRLGMTHSEDLLFYISISDNPAHEYNTLPIEVLHYRIHTNSAMANLKGLKNGYMTLYEILKREYGIDFSLKMYLKYRISRIMFLSFLRKKEYKAAFSSVLQIASL